MARVSDDTFEVNLTGLSSGHVGGEGKLKLPVKKVFPVYAMGVPSKANFDYVVDSGGDPIWVAVKEEARLEVTNFFTLAVDMARLKTFSAWLMKHMD